MSPPIRDGSGSSIGSIRLGDGSEIAEVRTGAGDVLFSAIPDGTVDNFEDADSDPSGIYGSNEDIVDYYPNSNSDSNHSRTTTNVIQGSKAAEYISGSATTETNWSNTGDGLNRYPSDGDTVAFLIRGTSGTAHAICLMVEDTTSPAAYTFALNVGNGSISIRKHGDLSLSNITNDEPIQVSSSDGGIVSDTWFWGEVTLPTSSNDTILYELYDVDNDLNQGSLITSVSTNDNSLVGNSGVGMTDVSGSGTGTFLDWIRVI
jgi:hypothetical protein